MKETKGTQYKDIFLNMHVYTVYILFLCPVYILYVYLCIHLVENYLSNLPSQIYIYVNLES